MRSLRSSLGHERGNRTWLFLIAFKFLEEIMANFGRMRYEEAALVMGRKKWGRAKG